MSASMYTALKIGKNKFCMGTDYNDNKINYKVHNESTVYSSNTKFFFDFTVQ
jgi:hypothetical protein